MMEQSFERGSGKSGDKNSKKIGGFRAVMLREKINFSRKQAILKIHERPCRDEVELLRSRAALQILTCYLEDLQNHNSHLLSIVPRSIAQDDPQKLARKIRSVLIQLLHRPLARVVEDSEFALEENLLNSMADHRDDFHQFVEKLYDFWRDYNRFLIKTTVGQDEENSPSRPYLEFNRELDQVTELVRSAYRNIAENITGSHPIIYRQVSAGFEVGLVVSKSETSYPLSVHSDLNEVPMIKQVTIVPPLVIDPPNNKRAGQFREVEENPVEGMEIEVEDWLCFPARVGDLRVDVFFHKQFMDLGSSLANLFELATGGGIREKPDAIYFYGVRPELLADCEDPPTVFYQDEEEDLLYGAVPREDKFGYFGYLKKMILTLHNIQVMKRGRMPVHGAMTHISLKGGKEANVTILGDSGAGKSETLEAFRVIGEELIQDIDIICDDMGSIDVSESGQVLGYGTETGAFVRLDDLQKGYAFSQLDRSVFMSPQKTNARALMPVTPIDKILEGMPINYFLYANNYEEIDEDHPVIEEFESPEEALSVFREGARMAKGTTAEKGLVHAYFANKFGPAQFREMHEELAKKFFERMFAEGVFVGQMRTRLGISGYETKGPEESARRLLELIRASEPQVSSSEEGAEVRQEQEVGEDDEGD